MSDDKTNRGEPDRSLISLREAYEVAYWTKRLGCTADELAAAVQRVGHGVEAVRAELAAMRVRRPKP